MKEYDVLVVGAGPVGIYAAFYGGMKGLKVKLVESLDEIGGQLGMLYPEKYVYDTPSRKKIKAIDLIEKLRNQMEEYSNNIEVSLDNIVLDIIKEEENFKIVTKNDEFFSKTVILTAGKGAYQPRALGIDKEDELTNIDYSVKNLSKFKDRKVAIFGGGDSAVDWANMILPTAKEVNLIHRRDEFRAHLENVKKFEIKKGNIFKNYVIEDVIRDHNTINEIAIKHNESQEVKYLDVDYVLVFFGNISSLGPVENWGLDIEKRSVVVNTAQKTNIEGIFACGDICTYDGKIKTITSGFGEVITAINGAYKHINGKIGQIFSSTMKK